MKRYEVEVIEHIRRVVVIEAPTAAAARAQVMGGVWPSGTWRRIVRRVVRERP